MALEIVSSEIYATTLALESFELEFQLDIRCSVSRTQDLFRQYGSSLGFEAYLDGSIWVRFGKREPETSLLIPSQDCSPMHRFFSRLSSQLSSQRSHAPLERLEDGSFFTKLREVNRKLNEEGDSTMAHRVAELEGCVAASSAYGAIAVNQLNAHVHLEVATFRPVERTSSEAIEPGPFGAALDEVLRRNVSFVRARIESGH